MNTVEQRLPQLFRLLLSPATDFLKNPHRVLLSPETAFERTHVQTARKIRSCIARNAGWPREALQELVDLLPPLDNQMAEKLDEGIRRARDRAQEDSAAAAILEIIDRAHRRFPGSPLLAQMNPAGVARRTLRSLGSVDQAARSKGETQANLVIHAIGVVVEATYRPYVTKLLLLNDLATGNVRAPPRTFGATVQRLAKEMPDSILLFPDAARLRNAAVHGHYRYAPKTESIELWDQEGWSESIAVDDLLDLVQVLHWIATESFQTAMSQFLREIFMPYQMLMLQALPPLLRGEPVPEGIARDIRQYDTHLEAMLATLPREALMHWGAGEDPRLATTPDGAAA